MALSNILREPRREIIETLIGVIPFVLFGIADYYFACWAAVAWFEGEREGLWGCLLLLGPALTCIGLLLLYAIPVFIHFVGEEICDALPTDPRPKQRYR